MVTGENQSLRDWAGSNRATLAILITDGVGWSALGRGLGDRRMKDEIRDPHFARGDDLISQFGGRKVKTAGDGVIAVFKNAPAALDCALELLANPGRDDLRGHVRAIIHCGELYTDEHDIQGTEADFAGRLRDLNRGAELWLSTPAKRAVDDNGVHRNLKWRRLPDVQVGDFEEGHGQPIWALREAPQPRTAGSAKWPPPLRASPGRLPPPEASSRVARRPQNFEEVDFLARADVAYDKRADSRQNTILAQVDFVSEFFHPCAPHARIEFEIQRAFLIVWNEGPGAISQSDALREAGTQAYFMPLRDVPPGAISVCIDPVPGAAGLARSALPPTHGENELSEIAKTGQDVDSAYLRAELRVSLDPDGLRLEFDPAMAASVSELERKHIKVILQVAMKRGENIIRDQIRKNISVQERAREE